jgi:hypothetical protein
VEERERFLSDTVKSKVRLVSTQVVTGSMNRRSSSQVTLRPAGWGTV